jgi:catechol 2,3-dioxygenase-like lactoylglutathione lyase family enzyme
MKLKSVSGIVCYVKNIPKTVKFYKILGFDFKKEKPTHAVGYSNWFWIDFLQSDKENKPGFKDEAVAKNKGAGQFIYLSVDDVDGFYKYLLSKKLKPSSEPKDWPWGNREFVIRDPDGYKLVIFKRK